MSFSTAGRSCISGVTPALTVITAAGARNFPGRVMLSSFPPSRPRRFDSAWRGAAGRTGNTAVLKAESSPAEALVIARTCPKSRAVARIHLVSDSPEWMIDDSKHLVLKAPHPSPLSASRGFFGCKHFSQANAFLAKHGLGAIEWV